MQVHHPNMNLWPPVRTMPGSRDPGQFFEEVSEDAEYAAGACALQEIVKRLPKNDNVDE